MKPTLLLAMMGVALVSLFGYHGLYVPQQNQVRLIHAQIAQERADQQAQRTVATLAETIGQYRQRLPLEADPSWLVREVVALGQDAGVQWTSISQEPVQSFESFTRLAVRLQFAASYHTLGNLLDQIERAKPFIKVDHLELPETRGESGDANVQLTLSTIYVPPLPLTDR